MQTFGQYTTLLGDSIPSKMCLEYLPVQFFPTYENKLLTALNDLTIQKILLYLQVTSYFRIDDTT